MSSRTSTNAVARRSRALPMLRLPRPVWLVAGVAAAAAAAILASPWILFAWIVPDLSILIAGPGGFRDERLSPRAILAYNSTHVLAGPLALLALGAALGALLPWGLIWVSHIAIDRALGYTPRGADGKPRRV